MGALDEDEELTENAAAQKRYKIRERVKNAIQDFNYLTQQLTEEDIELILKSFGSNTFEHWAFGHGAKEAIAFAQQILSRDEFVSAVKRQLRNETLYDYAEQGLYADIDVHVAVDVGEPIPIEEKIKQINQKGERLLSEGKGYEEAPQAYRDLMLALPYLEKNNPELYDELPELVDLFEER